MRRRLWNEDISFLLDYHWCHEQTEVSSEWQAEKWKKIYFLYELPSSNVESWQHNVGGRREWNWREEFGYASKALVIVNSWYFNQWMSFYFRLRWFWFWHRCQVTKEIDFEVTQRDDECQQQHRRSRCSVAGILSFSGKRERIFSLEQAMSCFEAKTTMLIVDKSKNRTGGARRRTKIKLFHAKLPLPWRQQISFT